MEALGRIAGLTGVALMLAIALPNAALAGPLGLTECGESDGLYQCSGLVRTWDGVPLDTTVTLPSRRAKTWPLIVLIHGFGNSKWEYLNPKDSAYTGNAYDFAERGYAVLTYTARGLWGSCGEPEARLANPVDCLNGYIHLADMRYEGRDTQELIGRLVDEGVAQAKAIGVSGDSYGGGQSLQLAALKNRVMTTDGSLVPWRSPEGTPLKIAASAPAIPWSDLAEAAAPNGRESVRRVTSRATPTNPVGVAKTTFVTAILAASQNATGPGQPLGQPFLLGRPMGFVAPTGLDPETDIPGMSARLLAGEPYDDASAARVIRAANYRSAYQVPPNRPPAPLLLHSGFTDDLFPVDEVLRFANRTEKKFPKAPVSLVLGDLGHQRASNKADVRKHMLRATQRFFDDQLRGRGEGVPRGVVAYTETCPRDARSGGPFRARRFTDLARGKVRYESKPERTITSLSGDPLVGRTIDPVTGGGNACATSPAADGLGAAVYRLPEVRPGHAFTLLGAPSVRAELHVDGARADNAQVNARLWDERPDGSQTLVARGPLRPRGGGGSQRWELHANGWRFAPGHIPRLELVGADLPFMRPSTGLFSVRISDLELVLPVR